MDLLIDTYGTFIGATGERITLSLPGPVPPVPRGKRRRPKGALAARKRIKKEYAIRRLKKIVILRPSSISMHAVQLALEHEVDIVYLGAFGKPVGRIFSSNSKGLATLRRAQLSASSDETKSFALARAFVLGKCRNQVRFMRHLADRFGAENARERAQAETVLESVARLPQLASAETLLGLEGSIAERYWNSMRPLFSFRGRMPQARDKFNSALNYGYGILYNEIERACLYIGLDPYLGLYHSEDYGKPALVLDLIEEFRVPAVDTAVIPLFISKQLGKRGDFERVAKGEYRLSPSGKVKVVEAVLKNLALKVRHHGKIFTLKSAITEQSEHLARIFQGKESLYIPFQYEP